MTHCAGTTHGSDLTQPREGLGLAVPLPDSARMVAGRLTDVGGVPVDALAERFGTPLYVLDRAALVAQMRAYRSAFGEDVAVVYATKALCVTGVLQLAVSEGLHVDVASPGELATAVAAGVPPERLVVHGNAKSLDELREAARLGAGRIVIDNLGELEAIEEVAAEGGRPLAVHVRVTPGIEAHTHEFIATGQDDSKFGLTLSSGLAHEAAARAVASEYLDLRGAHCHIGSQVFETAPYALAADVMIGFLADVRDRHGVVLDELNLGGGFGVRVEPTDDPPPLTAYAAAIHETLERSAAARDLPLPSLRIEPGRALVGAAGLTLYRVASVKEIPGVRTYVAVDGGMSDNPRHPLYGARHVVMPAGAAPTGAGTGADQTVALVGKHCESGDVIEPAAVLPRNVAVGDLVAVAATGAYNQSMASNYNRLPRPALVLVGDGRADVLVRGESVDDVLARDVRLPEEDVAPEDLSPPRSSRRGT